MRRAGTKLPLVKRTRASWLSVLGASALAAFLFAVVAASAPGFHHHLHSDADQAQHECALTIFGAGKYVGADSAPRLAAPRAVAEFAVSLRLHSAWVPAIFSSARIFEHAPPVFLSA